LTDRILDVLPLRRGQFVVEDDQRDFIADDPLPQLLDLPLAEVGGGIGTVKLLGEAPDDLGAGGVRQSFQFEQVFIHQVTRIRALARCTDQEGTLDRRFKRDGFSGDTKLGASMVEKRMKRAVPAKKRRQYRPQFTLVEGTDAVDWRIYRLMVLKRPC
jgi:hypothetical protein